jgi:UDP-N-acetylglucosamine--N-acetylmuramyl-(pentapeptide) pyrophosphoryl-undecaprenol N-acetylglucosamine transferase
MESKLVPQHHIDMEFIAVSGVRGKGVLTALLAPLQLMRAVLQALVVMRRRKPVVVFGAGGFVSGPGGIAAWLLRKPLVIHEQNAIAGMTNRWLAKLAKRVYEAFPNSFPTSLVSPALCVGNPVRREIATLAAPAVRFAGRTDAIRLLVVGGSLGAQRLNTLVPAALSLLQPHERPQVIHQTGEKNLISAQAAYRDSKVEVDLRAFIDDMAAMYAWADLVVCRAGALTVSELAAAGLASLLVPFPAAVDDHQTHNAQFLVNAGAAVLLQERELSAQRLADAFHNLCVQGRAHLLQMAQRAREQAIIDADVRIANECLRLAGNVT